MFEARKKAGKKTPITQEKIYRMTVVITVVIAGAFFLKNLLGNAVQEALLIGGVMLLFVIGIGFLKLRQANENTKRMFISAAMMVLVFVISLNSGGYFSDDFIMFLAVIALTGLYLEPKYSVVQLVMATLALIVMYILHPEKADPLGQYAQCVGEFVLTGILFIQIIKRGKAFIGIGEDRAKEAEGLVDSMKQVGEELEVDFEQSAGRINDNTEELQKGSESIVSEVSNMQGSCDEVQDRIAISQQSIMELNEAVLRFEIALRENQTNMASMERQLATVASTVDEANLVFGAMEKKMSEVADIADQLGDISFNTSILSLNASIEAARAGDSGAGFEVVATEMRQLSNTSNIFSEQVADVVKGLMTEVAETAHQFEDTTEALRESQNSMTELQESFGRLTNQFGELYDNIESQNRNVNEVGNIFHQLQNEVVQMEQHSAQNQKSVGAIIEAMDVYKGNIQKVIENTRNTELQV